MAGKRRGPPPPVRPEVREARFLARFANLRPVPFAARDAGRNGVPDDPPMKPWALVGGRGSVARVVPSSPRDFSEVYQEAALRKAVYYAEHVTALGEFHVPSSGYLYPQAVKERT